MMSIQFVGDLHSNCPLMWRLFELVTQPADSSLNAHGPHAPLRHYLQLPPIRIRIIIPDNVDCGFIFPQFLKCIVVLIRTIGPHDGELA